MGSSFSIYNDTDHDIYLWNRVQMDWVMAGVGVTTFGLGTAFLPGSNDPASSIRKSYQDLATIKSGADKKLAPGQIYTYNGSLSLTRSVYLMREDGTTSSRGCWTGPTDKSDIRYNVSRDWDW